MRRDPIQRMCFECDHVQADPSPCEVCAGPCHDLDVEDRAARWWSAAGFVGWAKGERDTPKRCREPH